MDNFTLISSKKKLHEQTYISDLPFSLQEELKTDNRLQRLFCFFACLFVYFEENKDSYTHVVQFCQIRQLFFNCLLCICVVNQLTTSICLYPQRLIGSKQWSLLMGNMGEIETNRCHKRGFQGAGNIYNLIRVVVTHVYLLLKLEKSVHLRFVDHIIYMFHVNKAFL